MNEYQYIIDSFTQEANNTNLEVNNLHAGCITSTNNKFELDSNGNLTVQSINVGDVSIASQIILKAVYPVGSIYMSVDSNNPTQLFGGVWERIQDTFLLACGTTYANGTTGGESEHKLTTEEMPNHNHTQNAHSHTLWTSFIGGGDLNWASSPNGGNGSGNFWHSGYTDSQAPYINNTGGSKTHNNMPPYLAVYVWKRVS